MFHNRSCAGQEKLKKKYSNFIKFKTGKNSSYREKVKTKTITLLKKKQFFEI